MGNETSTRPKGPEQVGEKSGDHVGWKEDKHDVGVIQTDAARVAGGHGDKVVDPGVGNSLPGSLGEFRVVFEPDCTTTAPCCGLEESAVAAADVHDGVTWGSLDQVEQRVEQ